MSHDHDVVITSQGGQGVLYNLTTQYCQYYLFSSILPIEIGSNKATAELVPFQAKHSDVLFLNESAV